VDRSGQAFERWSASHEGYAPLFYRSLMRAALDHLAPAARPGAILLDAGCGSGQVTWAIATSGVRAVGLDIERHAEWTERERSSKTWFVGGDLERLPLRTATIDAGFCFSALQYVERGQALDEIARVLKPGAPFAIVENLAGHPGAILHRVWRRRKVQDLPPHVVARAHPTWRDVAGPDTRFAERVTSAHALFAPLALFWPGIDHMSADHVAPRWARAMVAALQRWDRLCFAALPGARAGAWLALTLGRR
jgi:SAM-dependent methyltransferase